ncbi:MAG: PhzF family phenazine biosynthesis protein [Congregibacter sp.]
MSTNLLSESARTIDLPTQSLLFNAFAGDGSQSLPGLALGNPCGLSLLDRPPTAAFEPQPGMYCVSWMTADDAAAVRCWTPTGQDIVLCGHGLLCCGQAWRQSDNPVSSFEMNGMQVAFYARDDRVWIGLPSISSAPCQLPSWVSQYFSTQPWRAAMAGGDSDYLILEWPAGFDLSTLQAPTYDLRRRTQRSIIATCLDGSGSNIDIHLRYFAPQHGVPEDSATGSAMRVLATYWSNRELSESLHAYQCSSRGGELFSHIREGLTWVGGRVIAVDKEPAFEH